MSPLALGRLAPAVLAAAATVTLSAAAAAAPALADGCARLADAAHRLSGDGVQAGWTLIDAPAIVVGTHFAVRVQTCPAGAELVRVDATMPAHRHGMNYRPTIAPDGVGVWRVEGLMFHMRGGWELVLELRHGGRLQRLRDTIELP